MVCHHVLEETMVLEGVAIYTPLTELMFSQAVFLLHSVSSYGFLNGKQPSCFHNHYEQDHEQVSVGL